MIYQCKPWVDPWVTHYIPPLSGGIEPITHPIGVGVGVEPPITHEIVGKGWLRV